MVVSRAVKYASLLHPGRRARLPARMECIGRPPAGHHTHTHHTHHTPPPSSLPHCLGAGSCTLLLRITSANHLAEALSVRCCVA